MPRKMAGIEMITIDASIVAIVMLSVVLDSAIHLYLPGRPAAPPACVAPDPFTWPAPAPSRTLSQCTRNQLLDGNYLPGLTSCSAPSPDAAGAPGARSKMSYTATSAMITNAAIGPNGAARPRAPA